jgi:mono/diheme cytochrome c family protein
MKKCGVSVCAAVMMIMPTAAFSGPKPDKGLHLPKGNISQGQAAFVALKCHECHRVDGVTLPPPVSHIATNLVLGGKVSHIQTHGQLVTSIVNPSHSLAADFDETGGKDGKTSPMPVMNDRMTVSQLVDIVAFLESHYELVEPDYGVGGQ